MAKKKTSPRRLLQDNRTRVSIDPNDHREYAGLLAGFAELLEDARRTSARAVNGILTATYWQVGRRIVEFEQGGQKRAAYGEQLLERLGLDLSVRHGRGFWNEISSGCEPSTSVGRFRRRCRRNSRHA